MEQLGDVLYRELLIEIIQDYSCKTDLLLAFILSGKEPFNVFLELCSSVKSFEWRGIVELCHHHDGQKVIRLSYDFNSKTEFLTRNLMRHSKSLCIGEHYSLANLQPFFNELKCVENLKLECTYLDENLDGGENVLRQLISSAPSIKSIEGNLSMFTLLSKSVSNYKLEELTVSIDSRKKIKQFLQLPNISPVQLNIETEMRYFSSICRRLEMLPQNPYFNSVKKLSLKLRFFEAGFDENASSLVTMIGLSESWFANLEEFSLEHGCYGIDEDDKYEELCFDQMEGSLHNYQGGLKVNVLWHMRYSRETIEDGVFNAYFSNFKLSLPDFTFTFSGYDHVCTRMCTPKNNVNLIVVVRINTYYYGPGSSDSD